MRRLNAIALLLLAAAACDNPLEYRSTPLEPQLTVNGQFSADEDCHYLYVGLCDDKTLLMPPEATVSCSVNGQFRCNGTITEMTDRNIPLVYGETFYSPESLRQNVYAIKTTFNAGDHVEITVNAGGMAASVALEVPQAPVSASFDSEWREMAIDEDSLPETVLSARTSFPDFSGTDDWYRLDFLMSFQGESRFIQYYLTALNTSDDPVLAEGRIDSGGGLDVVRMMAGNPYSIFSDNLFGGENVTVTANFEQEGVEDGPITGHFPKGEYQRRLRVRLHHLDYNSFRYLKMLALKRIDLFSSDFTEPVTLPCNVKGGIGFVSISNPAVGFLSLSDIYYDGKTISEVQ